MGDEAYIESKKPRATFSKLLSDSREFFCPSNTRNPARRMRKVAIAR